MTKAKILYVEDSDDLRAFAQAAFNMMGVEPVCFASAVDALAFLRAADLLPDLAFVDLSLPDLSGEDFVRQLKADSNLRALKVILTSGWPDVCTIAQSLGAQGYLEKPFQLDQLESIVTRELSHTP